MLAFRLSAPHHPGLFAGSDGFAHHAGRLGVAEVGEERSCFCDVVLRSMQS